MNRSPCGIHIFPTPVARCRYCAELLREIRESPRPEKQVRPPPRKPTKRSIEGNRRFFLKINEP